MALALVGATKFEDSVNGSRFPLIRKEVLCRLCALAKRYNGAKPHMGYRQTGKCSRLAGTMNMDIVMDICLLRFLLTGSHTVPLADLSANS
jgi:hypothetical protein